MARILLPLFLLLVAGCAGQWEGGYGSPFYGAPGSSLGAQGTPGPIDLRPAPSGATATANAPPLASPAPNDRVLAPPPAPKVDANAPAQSEGPPDDRVLDASPSQPNPPATASGRAEEANAPAEAAKPGNEQRPDERDTAKTLQDIKKRLEAQEPAPATPKPQQPEVPAAQRVTSSVPTRPGFQEHYGALNHSGDVPPHSLNTSP